MACKAQNSYCLAFYRKGLLTPAVDNGSYGRILCGEQHNHIYPLAALVVGARSGR